MWPTKTSTKLANYCRTLPFGYGLLEKTVFPKNYQRQRVAKFRNISYGNGVKTWLSGMWGVLNKGVL